MLETMNTSFLTEGQTFGKPSINMCYNLNVAVMSGNPDK